MDDEQRSPEEEPPPTRESTKQGIQVFWEPTYGYTPADVEAELPDGTRVPSGMQLGGRRLGFDVDLPPGTWILLRGERKWPVGEAT